MADGKVVRLIANSSYVFDLVNADSLELYFSCPMTDGVSQLRAYQNLNHTDAWAFSGSVIPTKTSDLTTDSGFLTSYTETDPTVPTWAKASSKPTYTASEVGAIAAPSSPATGAFLVWNGTAWVAQTMAAWQGGNY